MALAAKNERPESWIDALRPPRGAGWADAARADALARLQAAGLPSRRDEYWKYTRPDRLTAETAKPAAVFVDDDAPLFDDIDRLKIVFVDGVFDAEASDDLTLAGVEIERLADAAKADIHWAKDLYGMLETRGQTPVHRPLAALNTAMADRWRRDPCDAARRHAREPDLPPQIRYVPTRFCIIASSWNTAPI